jgi:bifunctional pyridoxal-dependent enzyme with beta-cystathionase and maltose regulon repressor activities
MEYIEERSLYAQRANRGIENIQYLKNHTNFLTHLEKKVLAKIERSKELRWSTHLLWLDLKRRQIDRDYNVLRDREIKIADMSQKVKQIQQEKAIEQLKFENGTGLIGPSVAQINAAKTYLRQKAKRFKNTIESVGYESK